MDSTKDEIIPEDSDIVYICGGYVETDSAYERVKNSHNFRSTLIKHAQEKPIYAECAGLLYLGIAVDDKLMSSILDVSFTKEKRFQRMGYYFNEDGVKGHAFHYTKPLDENSGFDRLSKSKALIGKYGSWEKNKVFGTYLHCMFRGNTKLIKKDYCHK